MPVDLFTHTFKFEINDTFLRGECEFNTDGEASIKFVCPSQSTSVSVPLPLETLRHFNELMELIEHIHEEGKKKGSEVKIKRILIEKKV